ncbi:hypothetical protein COO60DRAFT_2474 [Scenedesmus sp. NREL 46B-D3]|nr:hypothetical protein COO60DRAFT_2474 [Scenedesmus sp. NREL 46B-D3]
MQGQPPLQQASCQQQQQSGVQQRATSLSHYRQRLQQRHTGGSSPAKSPSRSPRKSSVNRKWALLQHLKARNRSTRSTPVTAGAASAAQPGEAAAGDGSATHLSLLQQLQGLMGWPAGPAAADATQVAVPGQQQRRQQASSGARPDLDAAAATALQGVLEQALLVRRQQPPQQAAVGVQQQQQQQLLGFHYTLETPADGTTVPHAGAAVDPVSSSSSCAIQTEPSLLGLQQQPLLLPRMLSRAPLLDAQVQAGGLPLAQRQQLMAAATQTAAAAPDPVKVVLQLSDSQPGSLPTVQQQSQQQQHAPLSTAALVAFAAAAGAGAAAAVNRAAGSPLKRMGSAAQSQHAAVGCDDAAAGAEPAPQGHGVAELAQLILGAFEQQGGVIQPDPAALTDDGRVTGSAAAGGGSAVMQHQHQLLPNPLAGPAAPQFLQVVDIQDAAPTQPWQQQPPLQQQWQWQQQQSPQRVMEGTLDGHLNLGCCFAGCPERVSSPSFKGSPPAAASSSMRATSARRTLAPQQCKTGGSFQDVSRPRDAVSKHSGSTRKPAAGSTDKQPKRISSANSQHGGTRATGSRSGRQQQQQQQQHSSTVHSPSVDCDMRLSRTLPVAGRSSPLSEWREAQTQQLDQLWQQWQQQQQAQVQQKQQQQHNATAAARPSQQQQQYVKEHSTPNQQGTAVETESPVLSGEGQPWPDTAALAGDRSATAVPAVSPAGARAGAKQLVEDERHLSQQQLVQQRLAEETAGLQAAYARATSARAAARAAAERAAIARRQRMQAELQDLSKMLAEVDQLAADIDADAADVEAVVEQQCSELGTSGGYSVTAGAQQPVHWGDAAGQRAAGAGGVHHTGSFKHSGGIGFDGLLHLQQAVLEAAALGSEADALSRSLEGLGGVLDAAADEAGWS